MRWGLQDEATDDHMTSKLCMREHKACQQLSTGPNFIISNLIFINVQWIHFLLNICQDVFHYNDKKVYEKLKEYYQSLGYEFQVVDMRWGQATDDHMTSKLCMREHKACQQLSTRPNFIMSDLIFISVWWIYFPLNIC